MESEADGSRDVVGLADGFGLRFGAEGCCSGVVCTAAVRSALVRVMVVDGENGWSCD